MSNQSSKQLRETHFFQTIENKLLRNLMKFSNFFFKIKLLNGIELVCDEKTNHYLRISEGKNSLRLTSCKRFCPLVPRYAK